MEIECDIIEQKIEYNCNFIPKKHNLLFTASSSQKQFSSMSFFSPFRKNCFEISSNLSFSYTSAIGYFFRVIMFSRYNNIIFFTTSASKLYESWKICVR